MVAEVVVRSEEDLEELRRRLSDLTPMLDDIARVLQAQGMEAFELEAEPDGDPWLARYPQQEAPYVNVAGFLRDMNRGLAPKERRFQNRPAGFDTGDLQRSIRIEHGDQKSVTVGSWLSYAQAFQTGGEFSYPVLPEAKESIQAFLDSSPEYEDKLAFLVKEGTDEYSSKMVARPFMKVTERNAAHFIRIIEHHIAGEQQDG